MRSIPKFYNAKGEDVIGVSIEEVKRSFGMTILLKNWLNPVEYDGRFLKEIKDSYKTNELGFFITLTFMGCVAWSVMRYKKL